MTPVSLLEHASSSRLSKAFPRWKSTLKFVFLFHSQQTSRDTPLSYLDFLTLGSLAGLLQELSEQKRSLEAQVLALRNRIDMIERRQAERRALDEKRRGEEAAYLKHQAKHLDLFLKASL